MKGLRWYVGDAVATEDWLRDDPAARRFATMTSLTTLAPLGVNDANFEKLRRRLALHERVAAHHGSYFYEVYIYENVMRIHSAMAEGKAASDLKSLFLGPNTTSSVALMFDPRDKSVRHYPDFGWIPLGVWNNSRYTRWGLHLYLVTFL